MKKWIALLIVLIITAFIGYNYIYQDHRDIENEAIEFSMNASELSLLFSENSISAEQKFLNKTIEVSGLISEFNTNDLTIDNKVFCQFTNDIKRTLDNKLKIIIKGRVIGYDDLLEQVKLDQCSVIK